MNFLQVLEQKLGIEVNQIIDRNLILINEDTYFEQYVSFDDLIYMYERCSS